MDDYVIYLLFYDGVMGWDEEPYVDKTQLAEPNPWDWWWPNFREVGFRVVNPMYGVLALAELLIGVWALLDHDRASRLGTPWFP